MGKTISDLSDGDRLRQSAIHAQETLSFCQHRDPTLFPAKARRHALVSQDSHVALDAPVRLFPPRAENCLPRRSKAKAGGEEFHVLRSNSSKILRKRV